MAMKKRTDDDELEGVEELTEVEDDPRNTVLYGRSGTGKTTLAATWPKPILYLDIKDRGHDSIKDIKGVFRKKIEDIEDLEDVHLWLKRNPDRYKTVILDTVSQLQEIAVEAQAQKAKRKLKGSSGKRAGDFGTLTKQDWGQVASWMKGMIIDFRDLPLETVFIAQDRVFRGGDEDDSNTSAEDGEVLNPEVGPRLMPSVVSTLNAAVDIIGNTYIRVRHVKKEDPDTKKKRMVERKDYCLRIGPSSLYVTKVRKPKGVVAPDFVVDPDYEDIMAIIKGEK